MQEVERVVQHEPGQEQHAARGGALDHVDCGDDWNMDGTKLEGSKLKDKRERQKVNTGKTGNVWTAQSPDLNDAEHNGRS